MILKEILSGTMEKYDYSTKKFVTVLTLNNSNVIRADSQRQCTNDDNFTIGGCFSATMNITIKIPPPLTTFQVRGCRIKLTSSLAGAIGVFWVTNVQRKGRFFTLSCHDAVAWTDTSAYNDTQNVNVSTVLSGFADDYTANLQTWGQQLTTLTNHFIACATGVENMLNWENYHASENGGGACNSELSFPFYRYDGKSDSACPRDFYRYLAEISYGFVYATPETGALTLGQFAEPRFGVEEIQANEIEYDSDEFADYYVLMHNVYAIGDCPDGQKEWFGFGLGSTDYSSTGYFNVFVEENPFLAGIYNRDGFDVLGTISGNLYGAFHIVHPFHVFPLKCTVHGAHQFRLGQRILVHYRLWDNSIDSRESIVTKICWSFNGGQTIMCCGGDSRTLSASLQTSKADKVLKSLQNRCNSIEKRTVGLSQEEYDALESPDDYTLYCII